MTMRTFVLASAVLIACITPVLAETITGTVIEWDPMSRTITLDDMSKFMDVPASVAVPANLKVGDRVTIDYEGGENGYEAINSITIVQDSAK